MDFLFSDRYEMELTCADPIYMISKLSDTGIRIHNLHISDPLLIRFSVLGAHAQTVLTFAQRYGCKVQIVSQKGLPVFFTMLKKRAVLIIGLAFLLLLTLYLPSRVLFVEVDGNFTMETDEILEKAEQVGISFGASRKSLRSEKMKNALLEAIPQLKWAGINTYGCRAVISVVERDMAQKSGFENRFVQGIYAQKDGIITSITVTKGTPLCKTGEAIRTGQLLISGYTDCGLITRAESAEGEIYALTNQKIQGICPSYEMRSEAAYKESVFWRVQFGKKQIKLYIGSGNSDTKCGKIYETYRLTLPGGFCLPVSLIKETVTHYPSDAQKCVLDENAINALAEKYISSTMLVGRILHRETVIEEQKGQLVLSGSYMCEELVGKIQNEEIN